MASIKIEDTGQIVVVRINKDYPAQPAKQIVVLDYSEIGPLVNGLTDVLNERNN